MIPLITQLPCAVFITLGFCIIFKVPIKTMPLCVIVGTASWMSYQAFISAGLSQVLAAFASSCLVWALSNTFARLFKEASTLFIIPGIVCLVPGSGMYYTMLALLRGDIADTAATATETLMTAGAIASGLLVMGSISGVLILFIHRMSALTGKRE